MKRKNMVTLISRPGHPGQEVPRQLVDTTLTALHFLERQGLTRLVHELYRLCEQTDQHLGAMPGYKLREEGLIEAYDRKQSRAKLDPYVRAIVFAAVTIVGEGQVDIARQAKDIIRR